MKIFLLASTIVSLFAFHNAYAFSVDGNGDTGRNVGARFGDPDDAIPFPHVADDGQLSGNAQRGSSENGNGVMSLSPSAGSDDAFARAQNRMQQ